MIYIYITWVTGVIIQLCEGPHSASLPRPISATQLRHGVVAFLDTRQVLLEIQRYVHRGQPVGEGQVLQIDHRVLGDEGPDWNAGCVVSPGMIRTNKLVLLWLLSLVLFFRCSYFLPTCVWLLCLTCRYCTITFSLKYMVFIIFKSSWVQFFVTSHMYVRITFWKLQVIMVIIIAVKFRMGIYILILLIVTIRRPRPTATGSAPGNKSCSVSTTNTWNTRERAEGHEFDFGTGGHLRPLAATCSGGHLRPLAATCSGGHFWLQVAASGCRWKENAGGHWRPLEWLQVAADEKPNAGGHWRTLAATRFALADTGGRWRPLDWLQVAASGCRWEENAGGHWRPLIGRKGVQVAADEKRMMAATGGHWRPLEWLQVAASGCQAWVKLYVSPFILSWRRILGILGIFRFLRTAHGKFITFSVGGVLAMWSTVLSSFLCWGSFFGVRHGQYETF